MFLNVNDSTSWCDVQLSNVYIYKLALVLLTYKVGIFIDDNLLTVIKTILISKIWMKSDKLIYDGPNRSMDKCFTTHL